MKKIVLFVFAVVAIAGFGGITVSAHAATASLTPAEAAVLQSELSVLEAKLHTLQAEAAARGIYPASALLKSAPIPGGLTLSTQERASLTQALAGLSANLAVAARELAADPTLGGHKEQVASAVGKIGTMLAAIGNTVAGGAASPVASSVQSPPKATASALVGAKPQSKPTATRASRSAQSPVASIAPAAGTVKSGLALALAQVNWPLTVVIVLILAAMALWLFWPVEEGAPPAVPAIAAEMPPASVSVSASTPASASTSAPVSPK